MWSLMENSKTADDLIKESWNENGRDLNSENTNITLKKTIMKTFQITQNFGQSIFGWEYFDMPDESKIEEIEKEAIRVQKLSYKNRFSGMSGKSLERATIVVKEYKNGRKPKGGVQFSTKWR